MTPISEAGNPILEVRNLKTYFYTPKGVGKAVDGVSFRVHRGETLGILGESGSGKSMTLLSIVGLNPPTSRVLGGEVLLGGEELMIKSSTEMRKYLGRDIAMILQDPLTALNPVFSVGFQMIEMLRLHQRLSQEQSRKRSIELLNLLRVSSPEHRLKGYPHELSGGMRQRVVGAIALASEPSVLLADEPTTSLDVTVQAAFLDVLKEIQDQTRLAIVFVTHDFGVVADICDRVAVMYAGKVVETGPTNALLEAPRHPYTRALLGALPDTTGKQLTPIEGQPPSIFSLPPGCPFAARCPHAFSRCLEQFPPETAVDSSHSVNCWLYL